MPGTSRMPVSLRDSFNSVVRKRPSSPLLILNLELYVCRPGAKPKHELLNC